ncbi:hypothetical protein B0T14DRAFT_538023 [Immersiella caudata]|uniref:GYF domain-containing protein n=1 Tax=Immersiella caudata TaxID=314043 RepID=A0AA39WSH0_9PEZI|nr:hypothetical protein B0T14DRAFT_538023 [Immersiella caudata]
MPTQLPSSFASAAAGQNRDSRASGRGDLVRGSGSGEWPRSNGTRTFRRPSTTPFNQTASANSVDPSQSPDDAHISSANLPSASYEQTGPDRYSKGDLLNIYAAMPDSMRTDVSHLFVSSWNPNQVNGSSARGWGKAGENQHVPQDPTVCWDPNGSVKPISLEEYTPEEREIFSGDVNSTLKIPQQGKEGGQGGGGQNGRKASVSLTNTGNHPASSPSTASRPGTRRRETADTNPFPSSSLASPTASRFNRDEWLPRRSTDLKEQITDEPEEDASARELPTRSPAFGLPRANTGGSAFNSTNLWSSTTAPAGGAFGSFALNTSAIGDKRFVSGSSRLAHLIPKESAENLIGKANDAANADQSRGWRSRQRTDTDPFGSEGNLSGSAILGGAQDTSPTLNSQVQRSVFDTPVKGGTGDFGMAGLNLGHGAGNGPASPSETNPYRSPMADRGDDGHEENDLMNQPGHGSEPPSHYGTLSRAFGATAFDGSDRSQTSSVGAKGFSAVNTLTGWPGAPSTGTPDRERQAFNSAFGGSIFSPLGDLQSPGLGGLGGVFGAPGSSTIGRSSKLHSLFPQAMQAQMHPQDHDSLSDSVPDLRQTNPLGAIGRGPIGAQPRDAGSPIRQTRFEDLFPNPDARVAFTSADQSQPGLTSTAPGSSFPASAGGSFSAAAGSDPSAVRQMVMPDRMRWVYLDPQGTMQGPFNGLEMNDWYKANFFSPDLRVKRIEDADFEPLGQLIRRIGNSREPFLVPQMGIPHGPAPPGAFAVTGTEAVPPLQNAFPSFGRTLTAAQQNDLERRKQEEQLYHARQREIAHHHQAAYGRLPIQPGVPGALHHHSSAHSLQSQPSFGSISSPIGAPQPPIGPLIPNSSFFESAPNVNLPQGQAQPGIGAAPDLFNPDLNLNERQLLANLQASGNLGNTFPSQHAGAPANDSGLRSQLPRIDQLQKDSEGFSARVQDFHLLQSQPDAEDTNAAAVIAAAQAEARAEAHDHDLTSTANSSEVSVSVNEVETRLEPTSKRAGARNPTGLSLTERVKKTQADAAAAAAAVAAAAAKPSQQPSSSGLPMPFPPPASTTPIAAPTAQRPASGLPTRYDERSATGTPDTTSDGVALAPPPAAPWAGTESHKGPSLKEIQEAEAKKAAKQEEAAAALRRAALEQETAALREREKAAAAIVGLPATSTWGTGSPVGTSATGSPWKQPATAKVNTANVSTASTASKKTIADIQREEESRKRKALEAAALQTAATSGAGLGKRYADLASKTSGPPGISAGTPAQSTGGGWSTVGAGGKVKIPTGPAAQTRSASAASNTKTPTPAAAPKPAPKQVTIGLKDAKSMALEEFKKWLNRELVRGRVSDVDTFAGVLLDSPLDSNLIADVAYSASQILDGRHFADEFIRRKKLADRGVFDKDVVSVPDAKNNNNGGWNEVAKKGGSAAPKEETNIAGFRMVASKKGKGKKQ